MEPIEERLKDLLVKSLHLEPNEVTLEANLKNDLEMDSTEVVELIITLEKEFGIKIGDDEVTNKQTVGEITEILRNKLK
jgi:acyl carrier protein